MSAWWSLRISTRLWGDCWCRPNSLKKTWKAKTLPKLLTASSASLEGWRLCRESWEAEVLYPDKFISMCSIYLRFIFRKNTIVYIFLRQCSVICTQAQSLRHCQDLQGLPCLSVWRRARCHQSLPSKTATLFNKHQGTWTRWTRVRQTLRFLSLHLPLRQHLQRGSERVQVSKM